jgi:hypothetical protein
MFVTIPNARPLTKVEREVSEAAWRLLTLSHRLREVPRLVVSLNGGAAPPKGEGRPSPEQAFAARWVTRLRGELQEVAAVLEQLARDGANGVQVGDLNGR